MNPTKKLQSVAYHEAGHAVAAWRLRLKINSVTIRGTDDYAGLTSHSNPLRGIDIEVDASDRARCRVENAIMVCMAGPVAQKKFNPTGFRRWHAESDWDHAGDLLIRIAPATVRGGTAYWTLLEERTKGLIGVNWVEVQTLAEALLESETLKRPEIRRIIMHDAFKRRMSARYGEGGPETVEEPLPAV